MQSYRITRNLQAGPIIVNNTLTREKELLVKHDIDDYLIEKPIHRPIVYEQN